MKILAFINKDSGAAYHRITMPLLTMPEADIYVTNNLLEEQFEDVDIFMYNRVLPEDRMPKIKELQAKHGFKIVVDIDDYWELDPHHILYRAYQKEGFAEQQIKHLREADAILCTHDRLWQLIEPINPNVFVLPNAIPHTGQYDIERTQSKYTRLFWQGSDTHRQDVQLLTVPVESLGGVSKSIQMIMSGYAENNKEWYEMVKAYTANFKAQYKLIPYTPVSKYYDAYAQADICLIPLVNSPFNRCKSNLKVLEAANLGLPCVVSNVDPYMDLPVLYCKSSGDWVTSISMLLKSKNYQFDCGARLAEFCQKHYHFETINTERKQILEHITKKEKV